MGQRRVGFLNWRVVTAALLGSASVLVAGQSWAAAEIYVSTTSNGLPVFSSSPISPDSRLHLKIAPPARPLRRESSAAIQPRPSQRGIYDGLADPSILQLTDAASRAYLVPKELLLAVMHAESAFNPNARSPVGAIGLMQVMPPTGRRYGVHSNLSNPVINVDVGARYLSDLLELFNGDKELAVAAYNAGEGAVIKHGRRIPPYAETRAYVPRVMRLYAQYKERLQRR